MTQEELAAKVAAFPARFILTTEQVMDLTNIPKHRVVAAAKALPQLGYEGKSRLRIPADQVLALVSVDMDRLERSKRARQNVYEQVAELQERVERLEELVENMRDATPLERGEIQLESNGALRHMVGITGGE